MKFSSIQGSSSPILFAKSVPAFQSRNLETARFKFATCANWETYQRVVLPSGCCWVAGAAAAPSPDGAWKGAGAGSAWPVMVVSAGAGAAAGAAGVSWFWKVSGKLWNDIVDEVIYRVEIVG